MDKTNANALLRCHRCNKSVIPVVREKYHSKGMHKTAYCPDCNKYIKHLPQTKHMETMPFGKYKDKTFSEIADFDRNYLIWLSEQDITPRLADAIETALLLNEK